MREREEVIMERKRRRKKTLKGRDGGAGNAYNSSELESRLQTNGGAEHEEVREE